MRARTQLTVSVLLTAACAASPTPESTLEAYQRALAEGDVAELRRLSHAPFRQAWSEDRLRRWIRKNPRLLDEAGQRMSRPQGPVDVQAHLPVEGGSVRLVREDDGWRVAGGGVLVARFDTPEAALETFFFAATGHLGLLRKLIPEEQVDRYRSDYALGTYLYSVRDRIFRARDEVGPLTPGRAEVDGKRARLAYGNGKAVEMILQGERWRVLDVE